MKNLILSASTLKATPNFLSICKIPVADMDSRKYMSGNPYLFKDIEDWKDNAYDHD
jgi:hypothetical protein